MFAAALCAGQNPPEINFIQHIRDHLITSLFISLFPAISRKKGRAINNM